MPYPRIISHALAGKNSQEPRSCDMFVECGSSRTELYDNSTILAPTSNTFDIFATVAPDVEPTHGTSVRECEILAPNVGPTSNISILDKFATLAPERGARIGERLSSDFDRRVRSESGEVARWEIAAGITAVRSSAYFE